MDIKDCLDSVEKVIVVSRMLKVNHIDVLSKDLVLCKDFSALNLYPSLGIEPRFLVSRFISFIFYTFKRGLVDTKDFLDSYNKCQQDAPSLLLAD